MNEGTAHLYFHSPCFDGVVSAVLTSAYLEERKSYRQLQLHSVNYDLRERWLASELIRPCAVVDFLYHPAAQLWADHHATAFLNDETRNDYERRRGPDVVYDSNKSSCALLIWETWGKQLTTCPSHYAELI